VGKRLKKALAVLLLLTFAVPRAAVCAGAPPANTYIQNEPAAPLIISEKQYDTYVLGPGDTIKIYVIIEDNAVSNEYDFVVNNDGTIFFPGIGPLKISGRTIKQADDYMSSEIRKKIKSSFELTVVLDKPRMTRVYYGGDNYIPSIEKLESFVYVYGEVGRSGKYNYFPGKHLSDYLNMAGGPTSRANLNYTTVTRTKNGSGPKVFYINAQDLMFKGIKTNDIAMSEGDIINVPANFFYFSDFASFVNTVLLGITLYVTVSNIKR